MGPTGGCGIKRVESVTALIWKILQVAQQILRLNTPEVLPAAYTGAQYVDGVQNHRAAQQEVTA